MNALKRRKKTPQLPTRYLQQLPGCGVSSLPQFEDISWSFQTSRPMESMDCWRGYEKRILSLMKALLHLCFLQKEPQTAGSLAEHGGSACRPMRPAPPPSGAPRCPTGAPPHSRALATVLGGSTHQCADVQLIVLHLTEHIGTSVDVCFHTGTASTNSGMQDIPRHDRTRLMGLP